jgi:hypothetical protein
MASGAPSCHDEKSGKPKHEHAGAVSEQRHWPVVTSRKIQPTSATKRAADKATF